MLPASRRSFFKRMAAVLGGGATLAAASNASATMPVPAGFQRVVYHLSDLDKVQFVLGNIKNHIAGKGGPDKIKIALVVHGPALNHFVKGKADPKIEMSVAKHLSVGVGFFACGNTMTALDIAEDQLVNGFEIVSEGGVTKLADLQADGWLYLRP